MAGGASPVVFNSQAVELATQIPAPTAYPSGIDGFIGMAFGGVNTGNL